MPRVNLYVTYSELFPSKTPSQKETPSKEASTSSSSLESHVPKVVEIASCLQSEAKPVLAPLAIPDAETPQQPLRVVPEITPVQAPAAQQPLRVRVFAVESPTYPQFNRRAEENKTPQSYPDKPAQTPPSVRFESSFSPTPAPTRKDNPYTRARNFFKSLSKK